MLLCKKENIVDDARRIDTGEVITSEDLYLIENVGSLSFCCDTCNTSLVACSYKKDVNLRKPYFKISPGAYHQSWCDAEGVASTKKKGLSSRLTSNEGFPLSYPNHFKRRNEGISEPTIAPNTDGVTNRRIRAKAKDDGEQKRNKTNYETSSFKAIVNEFFAFPHDRDRALFFEGVSGATYATVFKGIENTIGKQVYRKQGEECKVYYSTLSWKTAHVENDVIRIDLSRGRWVDKKQVTPYSVEIDMSDWPKQTQTKFLNRYQKILETVRRTKQKAVIAFVGKQDVQDDYFRFYAEDRLLIAFKLFHDA